MIIKKLTVENFKKLKKQTFEFTDFDVLVGINNSGKSTVLQALAIWQFCVDEFHRAKRTGKTGIQIVLPNFTALPLPEFNLLWYNKTDRRYPQEDGSKKQEYIYIKIIVRWEKDNHEEDEFGIDLRYASPQSVYAIPQKGWEHFNDLDIQNALPRVVYVPPFSGLEPNEIWYDDGIVRRNVGKAQPGSVLRNLLYRVVEKQAVEENKDWNELRNVVERWFGVKLNPPEYEKKVSTEIRITYLMNDKEFDLISGGSGFHQTLTLLAFYYGYPNITTIMFDEPDAHMHVNLQRNVLSYLINQKRKQFIIATHSEEIIKGVEATSILSILSNQPKRIEATIPIVSALSDIDNVTITKVMDSPFIIYLEGDDDERIIRGWANTLKKEHIFSTFHVEKMRGGSKVTMKENADKHFSGLQQIVPNVKRLVVFDYDSTESFHPDDGNAVLFEWKRKNIENYLLIPDAWKRSFLVSLKQSQSDLFSQPTEALIDSFFQGQNLTLPVNANWVNLNVNIFSEVNGKKILFEGENSLFQKIYAEMGYKITRESVANNMMESEIHIDIIELFKKMEEASLPP